jgi:hypothetical protein
MPSANFPLSAKRHWDDAKLLDLNGRVGNAGQLYGFVAECGIKALAVALGYPVDNDGSPQYLPKKDTSRPVLRDHIHNLNFSAIENYLQGRNGAKYTALIPNLTHFSDWHTDHRYWADNDIPHSLPAWKAAATEIATMLDIAELDGILR